MRIFVASPFRASTAEARVANIALAWDLCRAVVGAGHAPFAPHLFYTDILNDDVVTERAQGIAAGLLWLRVSDELWVYAADESECSTGMLAEIAAAQSFIIPIRIKFMPPAFEAVRRARLAAIRAAPTIVPAPAMSDPPSKI